MKAEELRRLLRGHGATFKQGGKHLKVYLNGRRSTIPRHSEISDYLVKKFSTSLVFLENFVGMEYGRLMGRPVV